MAEAFASFASASTFLILARALDTSASVRKVVSEVASAATLDAADCTGAGIGVGVGVGIGVRAVNGIGIDAGAGTVTGAAKFTPFCKIGA